MKPNFYNNDRSFTFKQSSFPHHSCSSIFNNCADTVMASACRQSSSNLKAKTREQSTKLINFDNLPPSSASQTLYPGSFFKSRGVTFTSGSIPNKISVGSKFTFQNIDQQIRIYTSNFSTSKPNFIAASEVNGRANDVLMRFSNPIKSLQLKTDAATSERADVVRLLALKPTRKPFEFRVVAITQSLDNTTQSPENQMTLDRQQRSFSYALFQTTTEAEGFDDLKFKST